MMTKDDYQHFVCIVAGNDPEKLLEQFDKTIKVEPYIVYHYADAAKLKQAYVDSYKESKNAKVSDDVKQVIDLTIKEIEKMAVDDFYYELTKDYDLDDKTGDAISDVNPKGRFSYCRLGKMFSVPFLTKDGKETFQTIKSNVNWDVMHGGNTEVYKRAWEMVMEGSEPTNANEEHIFENMKDKTTYFEKFETKENYVTSNTAFWGYAFLSEDIGWVDADDVPDQFVWMSMFYDTFIKNLPEDTQLSIYECVK
jgi:hypothetical protein